MIALLLKKMMLKQNKSDQIFYQLAKAKLQ